MKEIVGTNILIAGAGIEGRSVIKFLESNSEDVNIVVADHDPLSIEDLKYKKFTGDTYLEQANKFDTVIHSPGISKDTAELKDVKHLTSATNIFFSECPGVIVGVTGTKGKSTTSSLIYHILESAGKETKLVGNIGIPALDSLTGSSKETLFVVEMSSYQLDDIRYSPHIAVVLPIFEEHLDYHGIFENYVNAKSNIVRFQKEDDFVVSYKDNPQSKSVADKSIGTSILYPREDSSKYSVWLKDNWILTIDSNGKTQKLTNTDELQLIGKANYENVIAATIVTKLLGVDEKVLVEALKTFQPLEHRLETVGKYKDITFVNDSLATVPHATRHAIEALENKVTTLIAGGHDRGLDYSPLARTIVDSAISTLILLPDTGDRIRAEINNLNSIRKINIFPVNSMEEAVKIAYQESPKGGLCLLSPASSSYNMFVNFAERGNAFKDLARKYGEG